MTHVEKNFDSVSFDDSPIASLIVAKSNVVSPKMAMAVYCSYSEIDINNDFSVCMSELGDYIAKFKPLDGKQEYAYIMRRANGPQTPNLYIAVIHVHCFV